MIVIIDYDAGNLKSVEKALDFLGEESIISRDRDVILKADKIILPGVGAFGQAMHNIELYKLDKVIHEVIEQNTPFLGICLGLQLMFEYSEEDIGVKGLALLEGSIKKIPYKDGLKIPHMGWNSLSFPKNRERGRLFQGLNEESYVYFVHSYYLEAAEHQIVTAVTEYTTQIHASVEKNNIFGCQFHPEKSSEIGLKILKNFAELSREVL